MSDPQPFAAELLGHVSPGLARLAAERTLDRLEDVARYGEDPVALWRDHYVGWLSDLSAALAASRPEQFANQVGWARETFRSRGLPDADLRVGVECLRDVLAEELPAAASAAATDCLDKTLGRWHTSALPETSDLRQDANGRLAARFLLALLEGDRQRGCDLVRDAVRAGELSASSAILDVCLPVERELGRMWHADEITVAEEHFVSAAIQHLLAQLAGDAPRRTANGRALVSAALAGDEHDIGLRAVTELFELDGWRVVHLGSDLPVDDLVWAADAFRADLVLLSGARFGHTATLRDAIRKLRAAQEAAGTGPAKVLVGGPAFEDDPDLADHVGADALALRASDAVAVGRRLVGPDPSSAGD
ncbi:MAG: cobalamin B12-binding domain-containing protein [Planctomycetota bacterium]|jgi:methanogenic corrinoid protein MtbC1